MELVVWLEKNYTIIIILGAVPYTRLINEKDIDTISTPGFYYTSNWQTVVNHPIFDGSSAGFLFVWGGANAIINPANNFQLAISMEFECKFASRYKTTGTWFYN